MIYKKKITIQKFNEELSIIIKRIEELKFPKGFLQFAIYAISEISANVLEHSKAKNTSIEITIDKDNFLAKIADNGIGLKESYLLKKIHPKDDSVAIEFALSGLSTKSPQERGFGLYSIRKLIEALEGKMAIESGLGKAIAKKNTITFKVNSVKVRGVKITLQAPVKAIDFYKVIS